jgi:hypothetical protein
MKTGELQKWGLKATGKGFKKCMHCLSPGCSARVNWCAEDANHLSETWKITKVDFTHNCTGAVVRKRGWGADVMEKLVPDFVPRDDHGDNKQLRQLAHKEGIAFMSLSTQCDSTVNQASRWAQQWHQNCYENFVDVMSEILWMIFLVCHCGVFTCKLVIQQGIIYSKLLVTIVLNHFTCSLHQRGNFMMQAQKRSFALMDAE